MVNSTQMSVKTIHSQLCPLASLKVQWRERRILTQSQPADKPRTKQEGKGGKLQSAKCIMNPPPSQVMTEQSFKMSRCGEACGKTSELNSEWGGRKNAQTDMLSSVAFPDLSQEERFSFRGNVQKKDIIKCLVLFYCNLIITNISVREWGFKEVFCQRKYIKD